MPACALAVHAFHCNIFVFTAATITCVASQGAASWNWPKLEVRLFYLLVSYCVNTIKMSSEGNKEVEAA